MFQVLYNREVPCRSSISHHKPFDEVLQSRTQPLCRVSTHQALRVDKVVEAPTTCEVGLDPRPALSPLFNPPEHLTTIAKHRWYLGGVSLDITHYLDARKKAAEIDVRFDYNP